MSFGAMPFEEQYECTRRGSPVRILGSDFCDVWETDEDSIELSISGDASADSAPTPPTRMARPTSFASLRADTTRVVEIVSSASSTPDSSRSCNSIWEVDVADLETMWAEPEDLQQIRVGMVTVQVHISDNNTLGMELCSLRERESETAAKKRPVFRRGDENVGPSAASSRKPATNARLVDGECNSNVSDLRTPWSQSRRRSALPAARAPNCTSRRRSHEGARVGKKDVMLRRIVHGSNPHLDALVAAGYLPPGSIIKYFDGQFVDSLDTIKAWAHDAIERHRNLNRYGGGYGVSVELGYLPPPTAPRSPVQAPWATWDAETLPLSPQREPSPQPASKPEKCVSVGHSQQKPQPSTSASKKLLPPLSPRRQSRMCIRHHHHDHHHRANVFETGPARSFPKSRPSRPELDMSALQADCTEPRLHDLHNNP